jgi:transposase
MGKKKSPSNRILIQDFIKESFGISYKLSSISRLLNRLNLIRLRPKLIPGKPPSVEVQEQFVKHYLELNAFEENDPGIIQMFVDGMHLVHQTVPSYCWGEKGYPPVLKTNTSRYRLNILGAYCPKNFDLVHLTSEQNCDSTQVINFLERIKQRYSECHSIILHLDNAKYFHAPNVREWLKINPQIIVNRLPAYAPNLNLIERLWRFVKDKLVRNRYYQEYKTFRAITFQLLNRISDHKEYLKTLINQKFEIIGNY